MKTKTIHGIEGVIVQVQGLEPDVFTRAWSGGFFGEALPDDASSDYRMAHAKGVERAAEDVEWRAGEQARVARAEGAKLLILELLCEDGSVEGSRAQADAISDSLLEPGFYEATVESNERLGMK